MTGNSESFETLCERCFRFLEDEFSFGVREIKRRSHGVFVTYQNKTTGVKIGFEHREGRIFVLLAMLINKRMPPYPIVIQPETKLTSFYLDDLIHIRAKDPACGCRPLSTAVTGFEQNLKQVSAALRKCAPDVLRGDFSVFAELDALVKRRLQELP